MIRGEARRRAAQDEAGVWDVACSVFLARHSAYLDGQLEGRARLAHERHQATCASCARYARVLGRGVAVLREQPEVVPSAEFEARLQHRLFHLQDEAALVRRRRPVLWLAAAAALAFALLAPRLLRQETAVPVQAAARPESSPAAINADIMSSWQTTSIPMPLSAQSAFFDAPYSPVIVQPPQYRSVPVHAVNHVTE